MFQGLLIIFCFLIIGYAMKLAKKDYSEQLMHFCINIAFPALIIHKLYPLKLSVADLLIVPIAVLSIFIGFLFGFLFSSILKTKRETTAVIIMASGLGNTSFVGFPFVEALFGSNSLGYALIFDQFGSFLTLSLAGSMIAAWGAQKTSSTGKLIKSFILFPPFLAIMVAIFLKIFVLPEFFLSGVEKLSAVLLPIVTIAVGMKIDIRHIKQTMTSTSMILVSKMLMVPLFIYILLLPFGVLDKEPFRVALIESAMPPMVMVVVFASRYGLDKELAVSAVALGIFISFATMPILYFMI